MRAFQSRVAARPGGAQPLVRFGNPALPSGCVSLAATRGSVAISATVGWS